MTRERRAPDTRNRRRHATRSRGRGSGEEAGHRPDQRRQLLDTRVHVCTRSHACRASPCISERVCACGIWLREHAGPRGSCLCVSCLVSECARSVRAGAVGSSACPCVCVSVTSAVCAAGHSSEDTFPQGTADPPEAASSQTGLSTRWIYPHTETLLRSAGARGHTDARDGRALTACSRPCCGSAPPVACGWLASPPGTRRHPHVLRGAQRLGPT